VPHVCPRLGGQSPRELGHRFYHFTPYCPEPDARSVSCGLAQCTQYCPTGRFAPSRDLLEDRMTKKQKLSLVAANHLRVWNGKVTHLRVHNFVRYLVDSRTDRLLDDLVRDYLLDLQQKNPSR
jgi:hypothetical protein